MKKLLIFLLSLYFTTLGITNQAFAEIDQTNCRVEDNSIAFSPSGTVSPSSLFEKQGEQIVAKNTVQVTAKFIDCNPNKLIKANLFEDDPAEEDDNGPGFIVNFYPPEDGNVKLVWKPGTYGCDYLVDGGQCEYEIFFTVMDTGAQFSSNSSNTQNDADHYLQFFCPELILGGKPDCVDDDDSVKWVFKASDSNVFLIAPLNAEISSQAATGPCALPDGTYDPDCYEFVSDFPFLDQFGNLLKNIKGPATVGNFVNIIFQTLIGIAGILAVIMIIYHAWTYLTTESISTKALLKDKLLKVLLGLVLLLGAFVILRTINPNLLNLEPRIRTISLEYEDEEDYLAATNSTVSAVSADGTIDRYSIAKGPEKADTEDKKKAVANGVSQSSLVTLSSKGIVKSNTGDYVEKTLGEKLAKLNTELAAEGYGMYISEAFKPGFWGHSSACHYKATCVDANITKSGNVIGDYETEKKPEAVKKFIELAGKNGLYPVFEVTASNEGVSLDSEARKKKVQEYIDGGVPKQNIISLGRGSGFHFSVYNKQ